MSGLHARVDVVEMKPAPSEFDHERLIADQRIKPNTRHPCSIMNVGAHIQLEKIRKPWNDMAIPSGEPSS